MKQIEIIYKSIHDIKPYGNNPRKNIRAVDAVAESIREFGFRQPIVIDRNNEIIAGHTRLKAAVKLDMETVPCIYADDLTEEQVKAYRLADNKTAEKSEWDNLRLDEELEGISEIDMSLFGFSAVDEVDFTRLNEMTDGEEEGYAEFEEKFKPKKTTDDCYTPQAVYEAVKNWAVKEYHLEGSEIIRPFYPGGDYKRHKYPDGCVVIDNPPFSILAEIKRFYQDEKIKYFLFAPSLTLFASDEASSYIITNSDITYENGAVIHSAFVTNLESAKIRASPSLSKEIDIAQKQDSVQLPRYDIPNNVVTSARLGKIAKYVELKIYPEQCVFIRHLDSQKESGKALYGSGFLISNKAAAEKAAAEKAAAEKAAERETIIWTLSEREKKIIEELSMNESANL